MESYYPYLKEKGIDPTSFPIDNYITVVIGTVAMFSVPCMAVTYAFQIISLVLMTKSSVMRTLRYAPFISMVITIL